MILRPVVVTLSDAAQAERAKRTLRDVRRVYRGPVVWLAVDFEPSRSFCDLYDVEARVFPRVPTDALEARIRAAPFTGGDGRELHKTIQWSKLHALDASFAEWRYVLFFDAGTRVLDVEGFLERATPGGLVAMDDAHPRVGDPEKRFSCQLESGRESHREHLAALREYLRGRDPAREPYFLNSFFLYDTELLKDDPKRELLEVMNRFPVFHTNEMGAMNAWAMRHRLWSPLDNVLRGAGVLYDWTERDGRTWRDYGALKYPTTLMEEDS